MAMLSIIMLTNNRLPRLRRCLDLLLPQLAAGDEVVLVDTGSTDGTPEHFEHGEVAQVRLVRFEGPGGWAEARNLGVRSARGEMIAFLDDDCIPAPDWVERGRAALKDADAVGGMVRSLGITRFPGWWHPAMSWMVGLSVPGHAGGDAGRYHYPMTSNLWAWADVCRAVPFQEIGGNLSGHSEGNYVAGREDAQWWRALRTGGYRTRFDPELLVGHAIDGRRLDLEYLKARALNDGRAWAVREGTAEDVLPAAYQWWHHAVEQLKAIAQASGERRCHWHLHRLVRLRQGAALRALSGKLRGGRERGLIMQGAFWRAGRAYAGDRGRTLVRRLMRPWLRPIPDQGAAVTMERLAVIAFGYLGDLVILQSVLRGLVKEYPHLTVYVLAPPLARTAIGPLQRVVISSPPPSVRGETQEAVDWLAVWLRDVQPYAIVAPYLHGPWGATLTELRHTPRPVVGFNNDTGLTHMRQLERLALRVQKSLDHHEVENLLRLLEEVGLTCEPQPAAIVPERGAMAQVLEHEWLRGGKRPTLVMLNPDAGQPQKEWTDANWAALMERMRTRTDWKMVVNASRPHGELERLVPAGERVMYLREAPLSELIAWMSQCRALVTVDAGPQHLAHALGVPSVTLYGPMDERRWRDRFRRPIHRTVRACCWDLTPEERRGLRENHQTALIGPAAVWTELEDLMRELSVLDGDGGAQEDALVAEDTPEVGDAPGRMPQGGNGVHAGSNGLSGRVPGSGAPA